MPGVEITIYDVARTAEVSISTVSNALNRPDRVAPATREKVLAAVDGLGYVPKADAVSKARLAMRRVAVVAPFSSYNSYLERLAGVLTEAHDLGIEISAFDHESVAAANSPVLASMPIRGQVDGIIVMGVRLDEVIERRLTERKVPTVAVDAGSESFPVVACDDGASGELAAEYLYNLGHRHFGYVVEQQASAYESQALRRLRGFQGKLSDWRGCTLQIAEATATPASSKSAAMTLLSSLERPTAVMAHSDDLALGVLRAAKELGVAVPQSLSVMGCDDSPAAVALDLTTIRQPFRQSGSVALRLLVEAIRTAGAPRSVTYLPLELVERATTGTLRKSSTKAAGHPPTKRKSAFVEVVDNRAPVP